MAHVEGMDALLKNLQRLGELEARKASRRGVTRAAALIRTEARNRVRVHDDRATPNQIFKNVVSKAWRMRRGRPYIGSSVGVLGGTRDYSAYGEIKTGAKGSENPGGDTFYWRFLEFGTSKIRPIKFLSGALDSQESAAINTILNAAEEAVKESIK